MFRNSRIVSGSHPARGAMSAVKPVFEVDLGLPDEVIRPEQVPVHHAHGQDGVLGEGGLELETPENKR